MDINSSMNNLLNHTILKQYQDFKLQILSNNLYVYKGKNPVAVTIFASTNSCENILQCDELTFNVQIFHIVCTVICTDIL